ncbi:MAG TPA: zf-HC2 domain-containing protein [Verrucomicrobiae bacterium]
MKPCDQNRKLIVWLTLNALDARQTRQVRAHLETCEGCRRYLAEISNVTERLAAAEATPEVQASESFHRNVAGRLRSAKPDSLAEILTAGLARLNWRLAMPVMVTVAMVSVMFATWRQPPKAAALPPARRQAVVASGADNDLAPTIANYQRVANQSLDKLDALLTRQGNRALPAMPIYTAATHSLAKESF